jgi:hypothetical protein
VPLNPPGFVRLAVSLAVNWATTSVVSLKSCRAEIRFGWCELSGTRYAARNVVHVRRGDNLNSDASGVHRCDRALRLPLRGTFAEHRFSYENRLFQRSTWMMRSFSEPSSSTRFFQRYFDRTVDITAACWYSSRIAAAPYARARRSSRPVGFPAHWQQFLAPNAAGTALGMITDDQRRRELVASLEARIVRILDLSQLVPRPSVWYVPWAHFATMPSRSLSQAAQ